MAILVLGGYGLIGQAIVQRLRAEGAKVIGVGRNIDAAARRYPDVTWRKANIARLQTIDDWRPVLVGADVVINAAGALQQTFHDDVAALQDRAMRALYAAATVVGARRIVQISAVGVSPTATTEFLRTKAAADQALADAGVEFVTLRPGLVISPVAYGGTALLRGLAAFPGVTPAVFGSSPVQTVWIDDLAELAVAAATGKIAAGAVLDVVERPIRSLTDTLALFRAWLGFNPTRSVALPTWTGPVVSFGADVLGWLGWRSPLRSTAVIVMRDGVIGNPGAAAGWLGRAALTLPEALARMPLGPQDRWFARLFFLKPLIIGGLAVFWIASGLIGLSHMEAAAAILTERGADQRLAAGAVIAGAVADIALGLMAMVRPTSAVGLKGMLLVSAGYLLAGSFAAPDLWFDPMGPFVKVIPSAILALVALAILQDR